MSEEKTEKQDLKVRGCNICGKKVEYNASNYHFKSNRCMSCWEHDSNSGLFNVNEVENWIA